MSKASVCRAIAPALGRETAANLTYNDDSIQSTSRIILWISISWDALFLSDAKDTVAYRQHHLVNTGIVLYFLVELINGDIRGILRVQHPAAP